VSNATAGAKGYTSGPGWDACTGFGSINGTALIGAAIFGLPVPELATFTVDSPRRRGPIEPIEPNGHVTLSSPALPGGADIRFTASPPSAQPPDHVLIEPANSRADFLITSTAIGPVDITITATYLGRSLSAVMHIPAPPPPGQLEEVAVKPAVVRGGMAATGGVLLTSPAPFSSIIALTSSDPAVAMVPSSVTVPRSASEQTFPIRTVKVTSAQQVNIFAQQGTIRLRAVLTVDPP